PRSVPPMTTPCTAHPSRARSWTSVRFALLLAAVSGPLGAQASRTALAPGTWAITNVNVIAMTKEGIVLPQGVVIVHDGRIAAVGRAADVTIPAGARRIDGRGGYLLPGFADMHTHLYADQYVPDSVGRAEMGILLANGITSARLMIGTPAQLALRREIEAGRVVGPNLWSASPHLTGRPDTNARLVTTPEQARAAVAEVGGAYDFVKITSFIKPDVYEAIMAEAKRRGLRVDGHVNTGVSVRRAAELGQNLQHLDGWFEAILVDSAAGRVSLTQYGVFDLAKWATLDYVDERKIAPLAGFVARSGVWSTPTLALFNTVFAAGETDAEVRARPDWALIPEKFRDEILKARVEYWAPATTAARTRARRHRYVELRNKFAKALADSGARLLAGSDAPDWLMAEGYTLHRELAALVAAGIRPALVLAMATRNAAEFLDASAEWGTIEPGKRADLVLLGANPLADISNTQRIEATAVGGRWISKPDLRAMVEKAARELNPRDRE
ncbi:MAG: amidohydrolase family protein, partial [Gemmatimonadota bacterium]